jgi:type III pantothenate kinase
MLLTLDIGNTNITAGVFAGEKLVAQWRLSTRAERTSDELAAFLSVALGARAIAFADIKGVAVSSVVPALTPDASQLARDYFGVEALVLGPQTDTGLVNDYDSPHEVGADRLVNALAAWKKYARGAVIVDFGTATTVDVVTADGHYRGGAIAPGLQIANDALFRAAARLPRVELSAPPQAIGRNTAHSLQSGIVFGYAGLVKELVARTLAELPEANSAVLATGGLAELIAPHVPAIAHLEPHLTLHGLRLLWERIHASG